MEYVIIFKALANETRLQILKWLKNPEVHFPAQQHLTESDNFSGGICVGNIQEKTGLSQSTISQYLSVLQKAGLLEAKRIGQWTFYRRNEELLQELGNIIREEI